MFVWLCYYTTPTKRIWQTYISFSVNETAYTDIRERVSNLNANFQHSFKDFSIYNSLCVHYKEIQDVVRRESSNVTLIVVLNKFDIDLIITICIKMVFFLF